MLGNMPLVEHGVHIPVLLQETMEFLNPRPGGLYVDATVGGGGHAEAILRRTAPDGRVIGIDQDAEAIRLAEQRLAFAAQRCRLIRGNFRWLGALLEAAGVSAADGILLDLGVSTMQLFTSSRGFSFDREGPLDMRMDSSLERCAADLVNRASQAELERIFREGGEARWARRLARAVVQARGRRPIRTTTDLATVIRRTVPRKGRIDQATKPFQAIRIAINDELAALEEGLQQAIAHVVVGGRVCIIAFHSLEEQVVKRVFRSWRRSGVATILTPKPIGPTAFEVAANPRARSARLRVAERRA